MQISRLTNRPNAADTASICALLSQLLTPGTKVSCTSADISRVARTSHLIVGRDEGGAIVGMARLVIVHGFERSKGIIEDVVVDNACRGKGYGRLLTEALITRARNQGLAYVDLTSGTSRTAANALYSSMGFERRDTNVYRLKL